MNHNHESPPKSKRNNIPLLGGLIALLTLVVVGGWYLFNSGKQSSNSVIPGAPPDRSAPTNRPIETEAEEEPLEIPEGVPEEDAPHTPTPGFVDDFEDGLDTAWTVIFGDALITNGQLTSNVGAGISAGDSSWKDYQIDFDVDTNQIGCTFVDTSNSLGVRVIDFDHAYWFVFTACEAAWSPFAGGVNQGGISLFPDTEVNTSKGTKHITIEVEETKMSAYENESLLSSIVDSKFQTGGIFLQIEAQTFYDNFKITLLP